MPRKCVVSGCTSNRASSLSYTATFSFPKQNKLQLKEWIKFLQKPGYVPGAFDTICVKHFDVKCLNKFNYHVGKNPIVHRTKLCLINGSIPTIFNAPEGETPVIDVPITAPKRKKSATIEKQKETEKIRNKVLMKRRRKIPLKHSYYGRPSNKVDNESSDCDPPINVKIEAEEDDYFLNRLDDMNDLLVINLRLHWLLKTKKNGKLNFAKTPAENDGAFPLLQRVKVMKGLNTEKNPLFWSIDEVYWFIRNISPEKGVAKTFKNEEVDGTGLVNLKKSDLLKYFKVSVSTAQIIATKIAQLRHETIQKFVNLE